MRQRGFTERQVMASLKSWRSARKPCHRHKVGRGSPGHQSFDHAPRCLVMQIRYRQKRASNSVARLIEWLGLTH